MVVGNNNYNWEEMEKVNNGSQVLQEFLKHHIHKRTFLMLLKSKLVTKIIIAQGGKYKPNHPPILTETPTNPNASFL